MCASPFKFLTEGPPPPRAVLLPDALFFSRPVPVAPVTATPEGATPEVGTQIELAFETLAPFPLAQLYYGYFWSEGSDRALAFAAYRRRFTSEQAEGWADAELVIPQFAAILGARPQPATTVVLQAPEGLTAVHWASGPVPSRVVHRPLPGEVTAEARAQARGELLRGFESKAVIDIDQPPMAAAGDGDGEFVFTAGELTSRFSSADAGALDVRDKGELAVLRRARRRDVLLWRTAVGCLVLFGLLLLGEAGLFAGGLWQATRRIQLSAQAPAVERIQNAQEVATRIENLRTKRLLTIEMLLAIWGKTPHNTYFTSVSSSDTDRYTLKAIGQTSNPAEISVLQDALQNLSQVAPGGVSLRQTGTSNTGSNFTLSVTFKPNALKPS